MNQQIEQLLEDYKRRLTSAMCEKKLLMESFSGITGKANTKYDTKLRCYRTIISELEKLLSEDTGTSTIKNAPYTIRDIEKWITGHMGYIPAAWNNRTVVTLIQKYNNNFSKAASPTLPGMEEWTKVEDDLPKKYKMVMIKYKGKMSRVKNTNNTYVGWYNGSEWDNYAILIGINEKITVTHWKEIS